VINSVNYLILICDFDIFQEFPKESEISINGETKT